jgi:mannose-1-phosphate guanylyltransferase
MKVIPVILAGGAGTRLWPLSRDEKPKQFHNLSGGGTLLEETVKRLLPLNPELILIVTSHKHGHLARKEAAKFRIPATVLCEPVPRNTAAAILYAARYLDMLFDDSIMISLPADHHIQNTPEFERILNMAVAQAESDKLVTIGIKPTYPETGYGYIKAKSGGGPVLEIDSFVEKPVIERARRYVESEQFYWNSGIFAWKTSRILDQFTHFMPDYIKAFQPLIGLSPAEIASVDGPAWELKKKIFNSIHPQSIDYGILEKTGNRVVIPGDFGWTDLGSWKSIDDVLLGDDKGNRAPEPDRAIFLDSENCSAFSETARISVVGLSNIVVVEAGKEILVIDKNASQEVKKIVEMIKQKSFSSI